MSEEQKKELSKVYGEQRAVFEEHVWEDLDLIIQRTLKTEGAQAIHGHPDLKGLVRRIAWTNFYCYFLAAPLFKELGIEDGERNPRVVAAVTAMEVMSFLRTKVDLAGLELTEEEVFAQDEGMDQTCH